MKIYYGRHLVNPSEIEVEAKRIEAEPVPGFPENVSIGNDGMVIIQNLQYAVDGFSLTPEDIERLAIASRKHIKGTMLVAKEKLEIEGSILKEVPFTPLKAQATAETKSTPKDIHGTPNIWALPDRYDC